jgi:hypothetical protein
MVCRSAAHVKPEAKAMQEQLNLDRVCFRPQNSAEHQEAYGRGINPKSQTYLCGACGCTTNGRVICDAQRLIDGAVLSWCLCSCEKAEPTILIQIGDKMIQQLPIAKEFHIKPAWPKDLALLYEEGALAFSAGAFTAAGMVARKLLMTCACHEKADEGKNFTEYVDYITGTVLTFPRAKSSIDAIRSIGNDANHKVQFISEGEAQRAMQIVTYMLDTIYSLPSGPPTT